VDPTQPNPWTTLSSRCVGGGDVAGWCTDCVLAERRSRTARPCHINLRPTTIVAANQPSSYRPHQLFSVILLYWLRTVHSLFYPTLPSLSISSNQRPQQSDQGFLQTTWCSAVCIRCKVSRLPYLADCLCIYFWGLAAKVRICLPFGVFVFF